MNFLKDMEFLKRVSRIYITNPIENFTITTVQYLNEDEDRLILQCAENIQHFKRGFVCDMEIVFSVANVNNGVVKEINEKPEIVEDLVLVYINKKSSYDRIPEFEYVFYK